MKLRNRVILLTLALLLGGIPLAGCGGGSIKLRWSESSGLKHKSARYALFDGVERKTFRAKADQTIELDYEVTVDEGTLSLKLVDPDGESLWEETFREYAADSVTLTAPQTGFYTLRIEGQETRGSFDLSWSVGE